MKIAMRGDGSVAAALGKAAEFFDAQALLEFQEREHDFAVEYQKLAHKLRHWSKAVMRKERKRPARQKAAKDSQ